MTPWNLPPGDLKTWPLTSVHPEISTIVVVELQLALLMLQGGGGEVMTTFRDLGNYVNGFTSGPHEI